MPTSPPKENARRDSWKALPLPEVRAALGFDESYTTEEFARIQQGLIPQEMEDKWFVLYEGAWLYLYRSWTGACIYGLRFEPTGAGATVVESWVSRDADHYKETRIDHDRAMVKFLIDALLLGKHVAFPVAEGVPVSTPAGVYQHHLIGRAYPETASPADKQRLRFFWERIMSWFRKSDDVA